MPFGYLAQQVRRRPPPPRPPRRRRTAPNLLISAHPAQRIFMLLWLLTYPLAIASEYKWWTIPVSE